MMLEGFGEAILAIQNLVATLPASQLLTLSALPIILLLATVECFHFRRTDIFEVRDSAASIAMGAVYVLFAEGVMVVALVLPAYEWLYQFRLFLSLTAKV